MHPTIQHLYDTFSKYHLNEKITGHYCPLCLNEEYNNFLHNTPLKQLTAEDFIGYLTSANIIDASCNDFKYFLPRFLEIIYTSNEQSNIFFEQIWRTLAEANYHSWPDREKEAVNNFFKDYWDKTKKSTDKKRIEWTIGDFREIGFKDFELT